MLDPGDVVILNFPGATGTKRRPAVDVSTALSYIYRPDILPGLRQPSVFRSYLITAENNALNSVGKLSQRDWQAVQACLGLAVATSPKTS